jgi:4-hydroxyproline epimerase
VHRVRVIDSHTGGEPTRVIIEGGPELRGPFAGRARVFREQHDTFRSAIVNEPRGSDVLVGALLSQPTDPSCSAGVVFFNNVSTLGMCGHGTIGLMVTLHWLGRVQPGVHRIETPVGIVTAELHDANTVSVQNVPSYRHARGVTVEVPGYGPVTGDVAWGGNWFYLVENHGQSLEMRNVAALTDFTARVRQALERAGVRGAQGALVDHIELFGESPLAGADSRNFVLCPGLAYDRSPCGTGTSAKLACLQADGKLREGEPWRQESITGSLFEGSYRMSGTQVLPIIRGTAWITGDNTLFLDPADPHCWGIR